MSSFLSRLSEMSSSYRERFLELTLRTRILCGAAVALFLVVTYVYCMPSRVATAPASVGASNPSVPAATVKNIPALTACLSSPDQNTAGLAVVRLYQINTPEVVAPLQVAAADNRPVVQAAAISALSQIRAPVDPTPFVNIAETTPDSTVRAAALDLLAAKKVRTRRAYALMVKYLEDPNPEVRGRAYAGIRALTERDYSFRAEDPPEKRADAVRRIHLSLLNLPS